MTVESRAADTRRCVRTSVEPLNILPAMLSRRRRIQNEYIWPARCRANGAAVLGKRSLQTTPRCGGCCGRKCIKCGMGGKLSGRYEREGWGRGVKCGQSTSG